MRFIEMEFFFQERAQFLLVLPPTSEEALGKKYAGIISYDFLGAYRKFERLTNGELQFCWAHLIREVKFLVEHKDRKVSRYGKRLLSAIESIFSTIHRRGAILDRTLHRRMQEHRQLILHVTWQRIPKGKEASLIAERLWNWQDDYFRVSVHGFSLLLPSAACAQPETSAAP